MQQNVRIREFTPRTSDWICKEDQIKAVVHGDVIPRYDDRIKLYHTYYIAGSRMKPSSSEYEKPLHVFELGFDRRTVLVSVEENDVAVLPPPTKLTLTSFPDIKQQIPRATTDLRQEFGASSTTKSNTTILIDPPYPQCQQLRAWVTQNKGTLTSFTLRSKFGSLISILVDEQIIPIANAESQEDKASVYFQGKTTYSFCAYINFLEIHFYEQTKRYDFCLCIACVSLTTKFGTTLLIDPPYPQRKQLHAWKTSFSLRSTSKSISLISVLVDEEVIPIANTESQEDIHLSSILASPCREPSIASNSCNHGCHINSLKLNQHFSSTRSEVKNGGLSHTVFWSQRGDSTFLNLEPLHFLHECGSRLLHMLSFSRQGAWRGHYEGFFFVDFGNSFMHFLKSLHKKYLGYAQCSRLEAR
ncbi:hypothetical protein RDI58_019905 [Solanum bulbocastanum]|uniref:Uncharacterized protein n=1 Tax=Solanum bulbocastanum TaxID=147425 RepID=A0AAN8Y7E8_SOLBU